MIEARLHKLELQHCQAAHFLVRLGHGSPMFAARGARTLLLDWSVIEGFAARNLKWVADLDNVDFGTRWFLNAIGKPQ